MTFERHPPVIAEVSLRPATATEKRPGAGFTTWCGLDRCRELAEYVGTRGKDSSFYCTRHAEAFAVVNGISCPVAADAQAK